MASPNTLKLRRDRYIGDLWLKGYYVWLHQPGVKGIPYKRGMGDQKIEQYEHVIQAKK